ncbi:2-C-methyl-D-erythritol 2,4-cyclodiphosphate synthase [Candidatus Pelagibacter sp.]|nr:2-C-methyl-D-erythritol 2,4-cyclodiphosphate synthase [Candidatus Pelagibacter sp.]
MNNCFIILAGGESKRFKSKNPKPYYFYRGKPLIKHSIDKAIELNKFKLIVLVINRKHQKYLNKLKIKKIKIIYGGKTRAESAYKSLQSIKNQKIKNVLIHDAARPNFSTKLLKKIISKLKYNKCVVPAIKTNDTVKIKNKNKIKNLNRKNIYLTQTPQGFDYKELLKLQSNQDVEITDDSSLFIKHKKKIKIIKGENENIKITTNNDVIQKTFLKYGIGFDVHRLVPKRKLYLGGIIIKSNLGTLGYSDGDPVLHAITDSILGACNMGDIGEKFSDKNKKYKNIRSTILLKKIIDQIRLKNYFVNNIDINIITQKPKISKFKKKIIQSISKICGISSNQINIKGKTTEKLGLIGKEKAIACEVITSVIKYA